MIKHQQQQQHQKILSTARQTPTNTNTKKHALLISRLYRVNWIISKASIYHAASLLTWVPLNRCFRYECMYRREFQHRNSYIHFFFIVPRTSYTILNDKETKTLETSAVEY